jgi:hypothetical protein
MLQDQKRIKLTTGAGGAGDEVVCPIVTLEICVWYLDLS